ncbi:CRISPR-associated ring nuclease Csm6 [Basilea psittacipulmonis]|uniref:CRISPR-associated protein n=1 Tax=Basilea psittacipulmonis DSM 24701 TaxID=1072685 RepID=A0A077DHA7_9BURK|nr:CRISPR-associated ring nuclease Csm6 [Basilea psittacipulmonis]AIL32867.1 CRISPR-associated protein [Basilea psittacipulmonis DSM 24701]
MVAQTYSKKILLSVTGMSPAVVTETLYALVHEKKMIPTEIHVITTLNGKNKVMSALLGIEGGRQKSKGALAEFCEDYNLPPIKFDESCIHVITNENDEELSDIRTPQENQLAADVIIGLVGDFCRDKQTQVHVSIAGGRKTMGFFMGYALSLYGREQDSLSHVLVSSDFENLPNFYYPKPQPYMINDLQGREIDASQAKVMLAEIPWVRLSQGFPESLLQQKYSYSETVQKMQELLPPYSITFISPVDDRKVKFGESITELSPRSYAFLLSVCLFKHYGKAYSYHEKGNSLELIEAVYGEIMGFYDKSTWRFKLNNAKSLLADSRTELRKKLNELFGVKRDKMPYLPSATNSTYYIDIDITKINWKAIEKDLKDVLPFFET